MAMSAIDTIGKGSIPEEPSSGRSDYLRKINVAVVGFIEWLEMRLEKRRSRLALMELTDAQLADIGISRGEAYREGIRSFLD